MLLINKWDNDYHRVVLGGITCDSHDYYDSEEHINEVFLPKIAEGAFVCGFSSIPVRTQDQISGHTGYQTLPDPIA